MYFPTSLYKVLLVGEIIFLTSCAPSLSRFTSRYQKVISYYDQLVKEREGDIKLKVSFAEFCYSLGNYQKVIELLRDESDLKAKIIYAKALTKLKEYTPAIEVFEQIKDKLDDDEAFYLYGNVLEEKNLFARALKVYGKVKGKWKDAAEKRMKEIETRVAKEKIDYVFKLEKEAGDFIQQVKDEGAIILYVKEVEEITPLNTSIFTAHIIEKILQQRGKELAEVEINYDSTYERVELEFARTITPQGEVIYAGKENIRDVTKYLNFPLYSNAKALIISMPSVEVGSIIEYKFKVYSSKLVNKDDFTTLYRLQEKYPIYQAKFDLVVPQEREVNFKFFNEEYCKINLAPQIKVEDNKKVYSLSFREIPPLIPESKMPPHSLVNPAILFSSFSSWEEIYQWWYNLYKDKIILSKESKNFVHQLIKDVENDYDKAKKIYEYVAKNIRYVAVEYGEGGYEPHKAEQIFLNRYGDCKDQAVLLVAMLREAGLKASPVLIPTRQAYKIDEKFPSLNFNHAIACVEIDGKFIFMDPTAETTSFSELPFSDQERKVLVILDDGYKILTTPQLKDNAVFYKMRIEIDKQENAYVKRTVTTQGIYSSYQRWYLKYTHPTKIRENIEEKMVEISPFSKLLTYEIKDIDDFDKSPKLEYTFKTKKFLNPAENLRIIPPLNEIDLDYALISKDKRNYPIDFGGIFCKKAVIDIFLPENLKVKYLPSPIDLHTSWFDFSLSYKLDKKELKFNQEFTLNKRFVEKEEYKEFKKAMEKVFYFLREEVILEKEGENE